MEGSAPGARSLSSRRQVSPQFPPCSMTPPVAHGYTNGHKPHPLCSWIPGHVTHQEVSSPYPARPCDSLWPEECSESDSVAI